MRITHSLFGAIATALLLVALAGEAAGPPQGTEGAAHETATFSMYCYWTGEATLGRVDGILASRIGHWGGSEIVQVDYDPARTDLAALVDALELQRSFYAVVVGDAAAEHLPAVPVDGAEVLVFGGSPRFIEPKHSLRTRHPEVWSLDLSERQAIALNSWSYFGGAMPDVLTVEQKRRLASP